MKRRPNSIPRNVPQKRTPAQKQRDAVDIARLYIQHYTQEQIADWLGRNRPYRITRQQISLDLKGIFEEWRKESVRTLDERKAEELKRLDRIEAEAWLAWEKSKDEITRVMQEKKGGVNGTIERATVTKEKSNGDPRFMVVIDRCVERRAKLLGLDQPIRQEISGPGGEPVQLENVGGDLFNMAHIDEFLKRHYVSRTANEPNDVKPAEG